MKIAIIGYSGSGKSTLAKYLSQKYQIPVLYLDRVHWLPGWVERKREESAEIVAEFLNENKSWVIDGNYSALEYERRMKEADKIVFMNFNRFSCFVRAWKRYFRYWGQTRESMGEGCKERMRPEFAWWLLHTGRTRNKKEQYQNVLEKYEGKAVVIRNQRELECRMLEL